MDRRARRGGALRILAFGLALVWSGSAWGAARIALVIGNGDYQNPQMLDPPNPRQDAQDLAQTLRDVGFTVELALDQTGAQMRAALHDFQRRATGAEIAAIYYAGHGATIRSKHYLAPVDASTSSPDRAEIDLIPLDLLRISVAGASRLSLVIVDACRDAPFPQSAGLTRSLSATRGVTPLPISRASDEVIAYAAADGQKAKDGPAYGNSPYAEALIEALRASPSLPLDRLLSRVRDRVRDATNSEQVPRHYGIGRRDVYLAARPPVTPLPLGALRGVVQDAKGRVIPGAVAVSPEGYALAVDGQIFRDGAGHPVRGELQSDGGARADAAPQTPPRPALAAESVAADRPRPPHAGAACPREEAIPPIFQTIPETIVLREAYQGLEIVPPRFRVVHEELIVDPERYEHDEMEIRPQSVIVEDAFESLTLIEPKFRQKEKMVVATPAHRDFQMGASGRYEEVLIPADERPIQTEIFDIPPSVDRQIVPAKVQTAQIRVVTRSLGTGRLLPAKTATVTRRALVESAQVRRVRIPALTQTITRQVLGRPASLRSIPCE